jgi:hypothetical protein
MSSLTPRHQLIAGGNAMRLRLAPALQPAVEHLALVENRSVANMLDQLVAAGLHTTGFTKAVPVQPPDHRGCRMTLPLSAAERTEIKRLARAEHRSNRGMAHDLIVAGLRVRGAWPAADVPAATDAAA